MSYKKIPLGMEVGNIYKSNLYGSFKIVNYSGYESVDVEFLETGYKSTVPAKSIKNGTVKDCFCPTVCGVGYFGDGKVSSTVKGGHKRAHTQWSSMLRRVYSEKSLEQQRSYKNCSVDPLWHDFQEFCKWFIVNYPDDGKRYHLDKDKKFKGNRMYGPETCTYISPSENTRISSAKSYELRDPNGDVISIHNMSKFCRDNDLGKSCMFDLLYGRKKQVRGWTRV